MIFRRKSERPQPAPASPPASMVAGDDPITKSEEDTLARSRTAKSFAAQILAVDSSRGLVVGVLGPWGSGKTSFVNLAREHLRESCSAIIDFNPWMFSGTQQLVESFFVELSAQLKQRPGLADIGKGLEEYGEAFSGLAWLPFAGPWIERGRGATKILGKALQYRDEGSDGRRKRLVRSLQILDKPLLVVIDDVDRLSSTEIRDIFKLVRLTAHFPNIIYLVAFDRARVEAALSEEGIPGRDYLEKILQVGVDLPAIPTSVLLSQTLATLQATLDKIELTGPLDESAWADIFMEIVRPLVRNMRDVRRYAAAVHGTVSALDGQVALADVLGLEAVRVFMPDVFSLLHPAADALTETRDSAISMGSSGSTPKQIEALLTADGAREDVVRDMISRLFPAAQRHIGGGSFTASWKGDWLKNRRVAHEEILRLYLERVAGEGFEAFLDAERAWPLMTDASAFEGYLRQLPPQRLRDVIANLTSYDNEFTLAHARSAIVVLSNLMPLVPEKETGMLGISGRLIVGRVISRLLKSSGDPETVEVLVREILPKVDNLSAKLELVTDVGYREGAGHKLVSEQAAKDFERSWRTEVRSASAEELAQEPELLRMLYIVRTHSLPNEDALVVPTTPEVALALLRQATNEVRGQSVGNRYVRRSARLSWDALVTVYGGEEILREVIGKLAEEHLADGEDVLDLAIRYASGNPPRDLDDE
ncbi:P-loop NTPase fold protein [Micromonospora sp. NPDC007208]|uniref:KAP family P-loop NTPase fold protein n=1 Tax=Micromonospora sp. NPDC007208 TaxID=3364236 RepID=UPI003681ADE3